MEIKHLLIIRLSAMGDVAIAAPVINTLVAQHPNLKITIVTKPFFSPILANIPNVQLYEIDTQKRHNGFKGIYHLYQDLKKLKVGAVADLHNVLRSKILRSLFKLDRIPIAYINKGRSEKKALTSLKNKVFKQLTPTYQRYVDVFSLLKINIDITNPSLLPKQEVTEHINAIINNNAKFKTIGIAPFAAHESKKYPWELMQEVILNLSNHYHVLLFGGGKNEISILENFAKNKKNIVNMAGKVTFKDELKIISNTNLMISMDSGNGHLAAMFGVPTITLWGATHPYAGFAPFLQDNHCICADRNRYPKLPTSVFGKKSIKGYENAMETISPNSIIQQAKAILKDC